MLRKGAECSQRVCKKAAIENLRPCLRSGIQISLFAEMAQLGLQGRRR